MTAQFKYTITVEKAEQTEDGLYIEGVASGMGVDSQGHEMDPAAIRRFEEQIRLRAEAGDPVPYLDWHNEKSVLAELGSVVKASVDEDWNLRIRVRLDESNPAALHLYRSIKDKGKKFGMSVKGTAEKWAERFDENQRRVLRFFDVTLTEVSNTTKPVWTPSFGTVLAKAVIDEADAESVHDGGDTPEMSDNDTAELQTGVTESAPADDTAIDAEDTTAAAESEAAEDADEVEVEKAGARYSKATKSQFLAMYKQMGDMLRAEGILDDEDESVSVSKAEGDEPEAAPAADAAETTAQSDDEPDSAETPETPEADASADSDDAAGAEAEPEKTEREKELERALAEMTARAEAAEAKAKSPQMVVTPESTQPDEAAAVREAIKALPREQRLVEAFRLAEAAKARR